MEELDELEQFKAQLVQVESLLSLDSSEQLETLKKDLEEAIAIMMAHREEANTEEIELDSDSDQQEGEQPDTSGRRTEDQSDQPAEYEQLIGEVYRVPFVNGDDIEMHEAEVIKVLEIDEEDGDAKLEVRFLYPLSESMKYFMEYCAEDCEAKDDNAQSACPLSHGYTVHLSMIKNALNSDDLKLDSPCLYRPNGGELWARGTIVDKKPNSFSVRPDSSAEDRISVSIEQIRPFHNLDDEDDDLELIEQDEVIFVGHKEVTLIELSDDEEDKRPNNDNLMFGSWEAHSSGFGSKMLKKMGYVAGKGLGKNQQGIVDPVQLSVLPSNTSLDACMELKRKGLLSSSLESFSNEKQKNYFKNLQLKKNLKNLQSLANRKKRDDDQLAGGLLNTINRNLATKSRSREPSSGYSRLKAIQEETRSVENVHVTIFKIEREMRRLKSDIAHVKKSISLCKEINPANLRRLNEKLAGKETELCTNELRLKALKEKNNRNKYDRNVKYF